MKWTRFFVALTILFAISVNTSVAFANSLSALQGLNIVSKASSNVHFQPHNDNLFFFLEEDFLEEYEEEFESLEDSPTFICNGVGTPTYLLRFLSAHRLKIKVKRGHFVKASNNPLFIVYQVFRI